jgi:CheY-like chemotaxis protein
VPTVLVVEDEWAIADWLHGVLSEEGYQVRLAINGQQALDVIAHGKPDVILADYLMPVMDGPGLLKALREKPSLAQIPVIIMSSLQESTVRERCDGFQDFLRKPFREIDVVVAVRNVLKASKG